MAWRSSLGIPWVSLCVPDFYFMTHMEHGIGIPQWRKKENADVLGLYLH